MLALGVVHAVHGLHVEHNNILGHNTHYSTYPATGPNKTYLVLTKVTIQVHVHVRNAIPLV